MFRCQECGKPFKTVRAAERATSEGCPTCGGSDVDMDTRPGLTARAWREAQKEAERIGDDLRYNPQGGGSDVPYDGDARTVLGALARGRAGLA